METNANQSYTTQPVLNSFMFIQQTKKLSQFHPWHFCKVQAFWNIAFCAPLKQDPHPGDVQAVFPEIMKISKLYLVE